MIKKSLGFISNRNVFLSSANANSIMKQLKAFLDNWKGYDFLFSHPKYE